MGVGPLPGDMLEEDGLRYGGGERAGVSPEQQSRAWRRSLVPDGAARSAHLTSTVGIVGRADDIQDCASITPLLG